MHEGTRNGPPTQPQFDVREPDAYSTTIRRRDKSVSPVAIQALDGACLSPCRAVGSRAAPGYKRNDFNGVSGTVLGLPLAGSVQ